MTEIIPTHDITIINEGKVKLYWLLIRIYGRRNSINVYDVAIFVKQRA